MATAGEAIIIESGLKTTSTFQGQVLREARSVIFAARRPLFDTGIKQPKDGRRRERLQCLANNRDCSICFLDGSIRTVDA